MTNSWKKNWNRKLKRVPQQIEKDLLGRILTRENLRIFEKNISRIFGIANVIVEWKRVENSDMLNICFYFQNRRWDELFEIEPAWTLTN